MKRKIGVLGLQGDFARHQNSLRRSGCLAPNIRFPEELADCDALVLPGGESTTFIKLLKQNELFEAIREFGRSKPIMGTCAGLITLATEVTNSDFDTLALIDLKVERNGYGRQVDSFIDNVDVPELGTKSDFEGYFIRAPKIESCGKGVDPFGYYREDVVIAGNENILVMTFHPELTPDTRIHRFFIKKYLS